MERDRGVSLWLPMLYTGLAVWDLVLVAVGSSPVLWACAAACWAFVAGMFWTRWAGGQS